MRRLDPRAVVILLLVALVSSCASGPKLAEAQAKFPPLAKDAGRIFLYRLPALHGAAIQPPVMIDNKQVGTSKSGGAFFADLMPGHHVVSIKGDDELILPFDVASGQVLYVRMMVEPATWTANIRPVLVEEEIARHELQALSYSPD